MFDCRWGKLAFYCGKIRTRQTMAIAATAIVLTAAAAAEAAATVAAAKE